jgi:hypothetical protein
MHKVKSGLFDKMIRILGKWDTPGMGNQYTVSLTLEDTPEILEVVNRRITAATINNRRLKVQ